MKWTVTMWALIVIVVVSIVLLVIFGIRAEYQYESQIGSYWSLADKSSTIPKKAEYIDKFVAALEQQHFEGEHNAILFPTLDNSFDRNFEALKSLRGRLREIEKMDVASFQYQTAIQQITQQEQGEADAMLSVFGGVWQKRNYFMLWHWMVLVDIVVLGLLGTGALMAGFKASDQEWGY